MSLELLQTSLGSSNHLLLVPDARDAGVLNDRGRPLVKVGSLGRQVLDKAVRHNAMLGQSKQSKQK